MILYNSYTGAMATFRPEEKAAVSGLLKSGADALDTELAAMLQENGFLVPAAADEKRRAQFLHQSLHRTDQLHLILMPTEACNFRCTYCYESFARGRMTPPTAEGVKRLVKERGRTLSSLHISWFGGEPLMALDIMEDLTASFLAVSREHGMGYSADISTNGYFLDRAVFEKLLAMEVRQFMITIDGVEAVHDSRRFLIGGGGTFAQIMENLKAARESREAFDITIRVNFDADNLKETATLMEHLERFFAGDRRFGVLFRPVGRWGGAHDADIPICSHITANEKIWQFTDAALDRNLAMSSAVAGMLMPTASVCYAAKPNALVIGAEGQVYKCTTALDAEVNHVGHLDENGELALDYDKMAVWVTSGEETDTVCQSCFYRPACQGNHCPWYRALTGERPCPSEKTNIRKVLRLVYKNSLSE